MITIRRNRANNPARSGKRLFSIVKVHSDSIVVVVLETEDVVVVDDTVVVVGSVVVVVEEGVKTSAG